MKQLGSALIIVLLMLNVVALIFVQYATVGGGLDEFLHSTSWFITEAPRKHTLIDAFPIFSCMALITAAPVFLIDRTRRGLIGFFSVAAIAMASFSYLGVRLPAKLDEYSIFPRGGVGRPQLMRIYGAKIIYYHRDRSYAVEINPHHLVQRRPYVGVSKQVYDFVQNALYQSKVTQDPDHNGGWQTDYCLRFTVESVGPYERIVFRHHVIVPDELVSCPKDAV